MGVLPEPITLNADAYEDRLRLLDLMAAEYPLPEQFPDPMDGIRMQTKWQLDSGRHATLWWSKCNYALTVWRLRALKNRGEFGHVTIAGKDQLALPKSIERRLRRYYKVIRSIGAGDTVPPKRLQMILWGIHVHSVSIAFKAAKADLESLPPGEREFAVGWGEIVVRALAGAGFRTTKRLAGPFAGHLPARVLSASDINPEHRSDLPLNQRTAAIVIANLALRADLARIYSPVLGVSALFVAWLIDVWLRLVARARKASTLAASENRPRSCRYVPS